MMYELNGSLCEINTCEAERESFTSLHALMRVMQRFDLNEKKSLQLIQRAWKNGNLIDELSMNHQRSYVERHMTLMSDGWTQMRVYRGFLFIFSSTAKLITAYPLPQSFYGRPKRCSHNIRKTPLNASAAMYF